MKRIVIKFGGTSVMDSGRIKHVARLVESVQKDGYEVVVVVSAMGHTTDHLLQLAADVGRCPNPRELDLLISTGEQVSAALLAIALEESGVKAQSYTGAMAGILTDEHFGQAKIKHVHTEALLAALKAGYVPVVAGFQGVSGKGDVTTLGRGGSDITAIALAASLAAERCDIYSDVDGVYSADPRILSQAYKLPSISYKEMHELACNGAQILNARSVEMAMRRAVPIRVRSTFDPADSGTLVEDSPHHAGNFAGLSCLTTQSHVQLHCDAGGGLRSQSWKKNIIALLLEAGIHVEVGSTLKGTAGQLHFAVERADLAAALDLLAQKTGETIPPVVDNHLAKISVVARDVRSSIEVESIVALTRAGLPIVMMTSTEHRLSLFVPIELRESALRVLHDKFAFLKIAA
ncbi:MAG: aspartate kinase [Cyanobacteria bacterium REEB67]|nr:aspartate kinase [Cyanobacteria bacterium REEB67]